MNNIFKKLIGAVSGLAVMSAPVTAFATAPAVNTNVPATTNIVLQKLQFQNPTAPQITNTGLPIDPASYPQGVTAYEPAKYGEVQFTLYNIKLTEPVSDTLTPSQIAKDVETGVLANPTAASYTLPFGTASKTSGPISVDASGKLTFSSIPSITPDGKNQRYVIIETMSPKTVVTKAVPMMVELPVTNSAGTGYLPTVTLYPKNEVKELEISLSKMFTKNDRTSGVLPQAVFHLYKGAKGSGTLVKDTAGNPVTYTTDSEGKILVEGLVVGQYYLVEQQVTNLVDGMTEKATPGKARNYTYLTGKDGLNDVQNGLGFAVDTHGVITFDPAFASGYTNYEKPAIKKTIESTKKSFDVNENIPFKITLAVPANAADYSDLQFTDSLNLNNAVSQDLKFVAEPKFATKEGTALTKGTDYTITQSANTFTVQFAVSGKVTPLVAGTSEITGTYEAEITGTAFTVEGTYENQADLMYNNSVTGNTEDRFDTSETPFSTYGAKFRKVNTGLFGSSIAPEGLAGAEFILSKTDESGNTLYFSGFDANTETPSWVASDDMNAFYATGKGIFTSGVNGNFELKGFTEGSYTLHEMKAPVGYKLPIHAETEFMITANSYSDTRQLIQIDNEKSAELVMTGSEKTLVMTVSMIAALLLVLAFRRKTAAKPAGK